MKNRKFEQYFQQYKNLVIKMVLNKTKDYQAAQEICQQVFIALYTNMDRVAPELVKAWLIRCTQHAIIDYIRRAKTHDAIFVDVDTQIAEKGNLIVEELLELHDERMDNQELAGRIMRTVRAANEQWYQVLMLHCVDGLSYNEIAEKLHISLPVLRARMYRARTFVREKFGDEYRNR